MTIENRVINAVSPFCPEISINVYQGESLTYCVFTYDEYGELYAESRPQTIRCRCQLDYFLPITESPNMAKRRIRQALFDEFGAFPSIVNATDKKGQHYVYEWECCINGQ